MRNRISNPIPCVQTLEHRSTPLLRTTGSSITPLSMGIDTNNSSLNSIDPMNTTVYMKAIRTKGANHNSKMQEYSHRARAIGDGRKRYMMCGDLVMDGMIWMMMRSNRT